MDEMLLDWDSVIENDGNQLEFLNQEGTFHFTVTKFERTLFKGSEKIPANCKMAKITLEVDTPMGKQITNTDIILYKTLEWRVSQFFRCIGQKQKGVSLVPNWNAVIGATGMAKFTYKKDSDKFFDVTFISPEEKTSLGVEIAFESSDLPF